MFSLENGFFNTLLVRLRQQLQFLARPKSLVGWTLRLFESVELGRMWRPADFTAEHRETL